MAAIADSMLPYAVMTTTGRSSRLCDDLLAEVDPAHAVHVDVGQHEVEVALGEAVESVLRDRGRRDLEPAPLQLGVEHVTHASVVVDDQDATFHDGSFSPRVAYLKRSRLQATCRLGR